MADQSRVGVFHPQFIQDLAFFVSNDRKLALRLIELIQATLREPFQGLGKPEPLKRLGSNTWSRRLNDQHRMVYVVRHEKIEFLQARFHY